ncbi:MAG: chemotaxis protein CheD [delta proteobacterium ML8_D]|nr:MAG: chemotaxis protein CheD [delta proteobacterium ML8_D]
MNQIVVGISDLKVSGNAGDILITYALGSCVGVAVYDPVGKVGGLLHFMLPDSSIDETKAKRNPAMFADTGIPLLFKSCYQIGAVKKRMIVKIAGGASIMDDMNYFRIGQKNITAARKIFWRNGIIIDGEGLHGNYNRTVKLNISNGKFYVKNFANLFEEL